MDGREKKQREVFNMNNTHRRRIGAKITLALLSVFILLILLFSAVSAQMPGDVNNDGYIDIRDVVLVQRHILGYQPPLTAAQLIVADVNGDGVVNVVDVNLMMQYIQGYINSFPTHHLYAPVLIAPVAGASVDGSMVSFQWGAVTGATRYQLEISKASDGTIFRTVDFGNDTTTTQYTFTNDGTQYRWRVRAGSSTQWGAWSVYRQFTNGPTSGLALPAPTLTTPQADANVSGTEISFKWNAVAGANMYELEIIYDRSGLLFKRTLESGTTSLQKGFPNDNSKFKWRVKAAGSEGWGSWSAYRYFINGNLPAAPVLTRPANNENVAGDRVTFEWNPVPGADRYELLVEYDTVGGGEFKREMVGNVFASRQTGFLDDGSRYKWTVRAGNVNGWGNFSTYRTFTNGSPFAIPTLLTPAAFATISAEPIVFTWSAVAGATSYQLEVTNVRYNTTVTIPTGSAITSSQSGFSFADAAQYRWRVRAGDGSIWGPWSAHRDFITEVVANTNLAAPSLLSPAAGATATGERVYFNWSGNPLAGADQIQVVRVSDGQLFRDVVNPDYDAVKDAYYLDGFPNNGTQFMWRVRQRSGGQWGYWSFYRTFTNGAPWFNPF
jgi:hypothetical protein